MRRAGGAVVGLELGGEAVRRWAALADGLRAPARPWGKDPVIHERVHPGAGSSLDLFATLLIAGLARQAAIVYAPWQTHGVFLSSVDDTRSDRT